MTRPLKTDVTANDTPVTVPTMPLARSRRSSGTSSVTHVDIAMLRIWPATEPSRVRPVITQNSGLRRLQQVVGRDDQEHRRGADEAERHDRRGQHHRRLLAVAVDVGAERRAEDGRRDAEGATDHAGHDDRAGLQVDPERQREPQERAGHAADERVDEQPAERAVGVGRHDGGGAVAVASIRSSHVVIARSSGVGAGSDGPSARDSSRRGAMPSANPIERG